jgi:hypothetical protein
LNVSKISGAVKFNVTGGDSCSLQGLVTQLPTPFDPAGKIVALNVGGATAQFTLDSKGKASSASGTFQLFLKAIKTKGKPPAKRLFNGGDVVFKAKIQKGSWAGIWAGSGVDKTTDQKNAPLTFVVDITLDGVHYAGTAHATMTSKAKSGGRFK